MMKQNCCKHTIGLGNGCCIDALNTTTTAKYTYTHRCSGITIKDVANNNFFAKHKLSIKASNMSKIAFHFISMG